MATRKHPFLKWYVSSALACGSVKTTILSTLSPFAQMHNEFENVSEQFDSRMLLRVVGECGTNVLAKLFWGSIPSPAESELWGNYCVEIVKTVTFNWPQKPCAVDCLCFLVLLSCPTGLANDCFCKTKHYQPVSPLGTSRVPPMKDQDTTYSSTTSFYVLIAKNLFQLRRIAAPISRLFIV